MCDHFGCRASLIATLLTLALTTVAGPRRNLLGTPDLGIHLHLGLGSCWTEIRPPCRLHGRVVVRPVFTESQQQFLTASHCRRAITAWVSFVASNSQAPAQFLLSLIEVFGYEFPGGLDTTNIKCAPRFQLLENTTDREFLSSDIVQPCGLCPSPACGSPSV